jgi:hypothetical protein
VGTVIALPNDRLKELEGMDEEELRAAAIIGLGQLRKGLKSAELKN